MIKTLISTLGPFLGTSAVAGIILTFMAPYGTHNLSLAFRLIYWIGLCMAGGLGAAAGKLWTQARAPKASLWGRALRQSLGSTLVVSLILLSYTVIRYGVPNAAHFLTLPIFVWTVSILICGFGVLIDTQKNKDVTPARPALFERLKPNLRQSNIYALSAEDHYVRVITSAGEDLILMRLSDAVKEVSPLNGLSPHRSWWVAETGVKHVSKSDGKNVILLKNDTRIPVSRTGAKRLKDSGWS